MIAIIWALTAVAAAGTVTNGETLHAPMPAGFVVGFRAEQGPQRIEERVPRGETVERWTRMVTVQRFRGAARPEARLGGHRLLDRLAAGFVGTCAGGGASAVEDGEASGRRVASVRLDCPLNPSTGKPETSFARTIEGAEDLYCVQYAFRSVPDAAGVAAARAYLAAVRLVPAG